MQEVYIVSACRTAIGSFGGSLKDLPLPKLGEITIIEALKRAGVKQDEVQEVILGNVMSAGFDLGPARIAAIDAGIPNEVPAFTVNKACGSGLKATVLGAQSIAIGDNDLVVTGGIEHMNGVPYALPKARFGYRLGHDKVVDLMVNGLTCPITHVHMGVTAENVAEMHKISREEQDEFAAQSYEKAVKASQGGKFKDEIVPVEIPQRKGDPVVFDTDEDVKPTPPETLAKLRAAFKKDGTVTAGNASGINDGGSALVLASKKTVEEKGLKPLAKIHGWSSAGLDPAIMGLGPARAIPKMMDKLGWQYDSVDAWELNEAFAAQSVGVLRELKDIPIERVNVHGGAVALGHPVGCSGARILTTLIYALRDRGEKRGVASLCIGGGMGIAMGIELAG